VLLTVENVSVTYGTTPALSGVSLTVARGEVVALLGANGAGKTTTLRTVSGLVRPAGGRVLLDGRPLAGVPAHDLVTLGLAHVPEGRRVFPRMSVQDNLEMGAYRGSGTDPGVRRRVLALFPRLQERLAQPAGTLSGGEQQLLALGRALMSGPRLLLLDEPATGLAPQAAEGLLRTLAALRDEGTALLLVEQAARALPLADRGYVLETGSVVLSGPAEALLRDDRVLAAHLGADTVGGPEAIGD
jgi:branched-chain amino acid transport system ATP-binding protein